MPSRSRALSRLAYFAVTCAVAATLAVASPARAQVTAFKQAVAEAAYRDDAIGAFYRKAGYAALWTGESADHQARRAALIEALSGAAQHGLPEGRYRVNELMRQMASVRTTRDLGLVEVALSKAFLAYARDVQSGLLVPSQVDSEIVREVKRASRETLLNGFASSAPRAFLNSLPPANPEYRQLMKEKLRLEQLIASGDWGPKVQAGVLKPGAQGPEVVALRNRLIAMGYMERSAAPDYGTALEQGVRAFQKAHGLQEDGVAGQGTMEQINVSAEERLKSVIVALERERWMNIDRGERHILVNQTDFTAQIIDQGEVTFETRSVIGQNRTDQRSPEFSDVMDHMVINPSWYVPRSIMTKEYLPQLQSNPNAARHLIITDRAGRQVNREEVDFTQYSTRNFPFDMRQPPGASNALGKVKFMFPNKYNIYLHDTPAKSLFNREVRAFSHGCIRLADPFDFAYALLSRQSDDPRGLFHSVLNSGRETRVELEQPVPVHLIYRTALISSRGSVEFRRDVYGRDAKIWNALSQAGVVLTPVQG